LTSVILVRHAPPLVTGTCAGRSEIAVEPAPAAAELVLRSLAALTRPTRIVSSPARRCHDLAHELSLRLDLPLALDPRLLEIDFGEWEGRTWDEITRNDGLRLERWMARWRDEGPPGGETIAELERRVRDCLSEGFLDGDSTRLAVTHAGVIRAVRVLAGERTWENALSEPVPYLVPLAFEWPGPAT
jgi:alpha-ribazole phosphatase